MTPPDTAGIVPAVERALVAAGIPADAPVLVAFSGGADSTALLVAARRLGRRVVALHCNFHLRGDESNRDERFCRHMAERLGAEIRVSHFDVPARMRATGESLEMAARELRYEWFAQCRAEIADRAASPLVPLLTGHHAGDNVETFFLNLMRGSGLRGLAAIPSSRDYILRPLLAIPKSAIVSFLSDAALPFITDSSNLVPDVKRNRLRLQALPALDEMFPGFSAEVSRSALNLRRDFQLLSALVADRRSLFEDCDGAIDVAALASEPLASSLLYHFLDGALHIHTIERILADTSATGRIFQGSGGVRWLLDRGKLRPLSSDDPVAPVPPHISSQLLPVADFAPGRDPAVMWLDADAIPPDAEWQLRPWRHADRIAPFGMRGTRPVSSIIAEAKIPLHRKSHVWILLCNDTPLWVVGIRASCHFAVNESTKRVWRLQAEL